MVPAVGVSRRSLAPRLIVAYRTIQKLTAPESRLLSSSTLSSCWPQRDLFAEKIKEVDPVTWFPDYTGGCNYDAAEAYFKKAFRARGKSRRRFVTTLPSSPLGAYLSPPPRMSSTIKSDTPDTTRTLLWFLSRTQPAPTCAAHSP